jgi:predicted DNA-binding antitoxin AbrB/MazE fold protein
MTIEATYRDGAFYPVHPISLPENTRAEVIVVSQNGETPDKRLTSPKISSEEFRARIAKHAVSVGTLPPDFSRDDIYSDHD